MCTMNTPHDTTVDAQRAQNDVWRKLGGAKRVEIALRMSDDARSIAIDGVRARHPSYSADQALHAILRVLLGDELYQRAWPGHELLLP